MSKDVSQREAWMRKIQEGLRKGTYKRDETGHIVRVRKEVHREIHFGNNQRVREFQTAARSRRNRFKERKESQLLEVVAYNDFLELAETVGLTASYYSCIDPRFWHYHFWPLRLYEVSRFESK